LTSFDELVSSANDGGSADASASDASAADGSSDAGAKNESGAVADAGTDAAATDAMSADATIDSGSLDAGGDGGYPAAVLADSPSLYWRLDDPTTITDTSGNGHTGAINGAALVQTTSAIVTGGSGATFDGGTFISGGNLFTFANQTPFSLEAWVRPTNTTDTFNVGGREQDPDDGWMVYVYKGQLILERESDAGSDHATSAAISATAYTHVVVTYDGATMAVYVNGLIAASKTSTLLIPSMPPVPFVIAGGDNGTSYRFIGDLDEIAVYDHVLAPGRVNAHYKAGLGLP
jgi:hypothetical protein